jgi:hypothetical protein
MLLPFVTEFRRRRTPMKQRTQAAPAPPPVALTVVGVENGEFPGGDEGSVDVSVNTTPAQPLNDPGAADPGKWSVRFGEQRYGGSLLTLLSYNTIRVAMSNQFGEGGADVLDYFDSPSDIADALGRQLGALNDFPI